VLRAEIEGANLTLADYARIFSHDGKLLLVLVPFGFFLDHAGLKRCGILASIMLGVGLMLFSFAASNAVCVDVGFTIIGFASATHPPFGSSVSREGGSGSAALIMSAQAGDFDCGTMAFAIFSLELPVSLE
jgi:hypothetical protein